MFEILLRRGDRSFLSEIAVPVERFVVQDIRYKQTNNTNLENVNLIQQKCALTSWRIQVSAILFRPASREDERRVGIAPEVVAILEAVEVESDAVTFDLDDSADAVVRRVAGVDRLKLLVHLKLVRVALDVLKLKIIQINLFAFKFTKYRCFAGYLRL